MKLLLPFLILPLFASEPITSSAGITLITIPSGTFTMGSPDSEKSRSRDEAQREVKITSPFYIATTEVTQKQWLSVMGTTFEDLINKQRGPAGRGANLSSKPSAIGEEQPMCFVNWADAQEFCEALTKKDQDAKIIPEI